MRDVNRGCIVRGHLELIAAWFVDHEHARDPCGELVVGLQARPGCTAATVVELRDDDHLVRHAEEDVRNIAAPALVDVVILCLQPRSKHVVLQPAVAMQHGEHVSHVVRRNELVDIIRFTLLVDQSHAFLHGFHGHTLIVQVVNTKAPAGDVGVLPGLEAVICRTGGRLEKSHLVLQLPLADHQRSPEAHVAVGAEAVEFEDSAFHRRLKVGADMVVGAAVQSRERDGELGPPACLGVLCVGHLERVDIVLLVLLFQTLDDDPNHVLDVLHVDLHPWISIILVRAPGPVRVEL
mmetsp:Transcript_27896/g.65520  ORF Transcript_27896/g.65520 Transcript_27896/m.65520 type:complete len:293 (+) Transcript_27896:1485-2363(+)